MLSYRSYPSDSKGDVYSEIKHAASELNKLNAPRAQVRVETFHPSLPASDTDGPAWDTVCPDRNRYRRNRFSQETRR